MFSSLSAGPCLVIASLLDDTSLVRLCVRTCLDLGWDDRFILSSRKQSIELDSESKTRCLSMATEREPETLFFTD